MIKRAPTRPIALLFAVFLLASCSGGVDDDNQEQPWEFEEVADPFAQVSSPASTNYRFMGSIGDSLYFHLGPRADETALIARYRPERGWSYDHALGELLAAPLDDQFQALPPRIIKADDFHLLLAKRPTRLLRSSDQGRTWETLSPPPLEGDLQILNGPEGLKTTSRGVAPLYLRGLQPDSERADVLISHDFGQSWQSLSDRNSPYQALPGLLISETHFSLDADDSFQPLPDSCHHRDSLFGWFLHADRYHLVRPTELLQWVPGEECIALEVEGIGADPDDPESPDELLRVEILGDQVFAITASGRLGRLVDDLAAFQELPLPAGESLIPQGPLQGRSLFDLGDKGLGLQTFRGIWTRVDQESPWRLSAPEKTSLTAISEHQGLLYTHQQDWLFRRPLDSDQWERFNFHVDDQPHRGQPLTLLKIREKSFAVGRHLPVLYETGRTSWHLTELFRDEVEFLPPHPFPLTPPALKLLDAGDHGILMLSRGSLPLAALPGSDRADQADEYEISAGGVFLSPGLDPFEPAPFGTGLPTSPRGRAATIHSAALHDDQIFVLTGIQGVHRAPLASAQWTDAHQGLPTAENASEGQQILGLRSIQNRLYAFSADAVFTWNGFAWDRLTAEPFLASTADPLRPLGIVNLLFFNDRLLLAAHNGLHLLDPDTGETSQLWHYDNRILQVAETLPSGLYLGLQNGGLWRLSPH